MIAIKNPNLSFTTIKDNVKCTTLKELEREEQMSIDEHNSLNSYSGLNCVRAYRCPELKCDYKQESDRKTIGTNPINGVFRLYISNNKNELCNENKIPIQIIQYDKTSKHSLKTQHIDSIINRITSEWKLFVKVFYIFYLKRKINIMDIL